jgi:hypothetical protein
MRFVARAISQSLILLFRWLIKKPRYDTLRDLDAKTFLLIKVNEVFNDIFCASSFRELPQIEA